MLATTGRRRHRREPTWGHIHQGQCPIRAVGRGHHWGFPLPLPSSSEYRDSVRLSVREVFAAYSTRCAAASCASSVQRRLSVTGGRDSWSGSCVPAAPCALVPAQGQAWYHLSVTAY